MSSGQTLLALGAMILLGKLALSTSAFLADADMLQMQAEAVTTATTIGQSMIEKISVRGFDHIYLGRDDSVTVDMFVRPTQLGRDTGEPAGRDTLFNDVDDFRGFTDSVSTPRFGKFYLSCNVYYVSDAAPYDSICTQSFLKRIDVSVSNTFMMDPNDPLKLKVPVTVSRYVGYN